MRITTLAAMLLAAAHASGWQSSGLDEETEKERAAIFDREHPLSQGTVGDEALIALNVSSGLDLEEDFASPAAIRSAAGYSSSAMQSGERSHMGRTGFVDQNWNSGLDARSQGATSMTAQFGTGTGTYTMSTPNP